MLNQNNDEANIANNQEPDQAHRPQGDCAECSSSAEDNASFERDEYSDHGAAIVHGEALAADFIARNDYLERAQAAAEAGDRELAHAICSLRLMRKHASVRQLRTIPAIAALRRAWGIACDMKERSLAEYIFDKLEPHLSTDEAPEYAKRLQNLALDKLSEFGISRADLEGVADMISEEIGQNVHITGISPIMSMLFRAILAPILPTIPTSRARRPLRPTCTGCAFEGRAHAALFRFGGLRQHYRRRSLARVGR